MVVGEELGVRRGKEPDFLFRRGEEIVGVEFTSGADSSLAHAGRESHKIAEELQTELTSRGITSLHVHLAFVETSALNVGAGKQRIRNIVTLADAIERRLPLGEDGVVEKNPEKEGVHFLSASTVGRGEGLSVLKLGERLHGRQTTVLQPCIDRKNLPSERQCRSCEARGQVRRRVARGHVVRPRRRRKLGVERPRRSPEDICPKSIEHPIRI